MSLDAIRTNDLMPDIQNANSDQQKVEMLLDYIIQIKEQLSWELDTMKKRILILETAAKSAKNTTPNSGTITPQDTAAPMMLSADPAEKEETDDI